MPATGTQLIERTRRFMGDWPEQDVTTASAASNGTTLTVASDANDRYGVNQWLEIGSEKILVTSVASTTTLTVRRALGGTTAASIASGATILQSPRFFETEYLDAINYGIHSCWPWVYRPVIDTSISTTADTYEYTIPNMPNPNELLHEQNSTFEGGVGDWATAGTNSIATSGTESYEGDASMKVTYQDNSSLALLQTTRPHAGPFRFSAKVYLPANFDAVQVDLATTAFGASGRQASALLDMTKTDQWQHVEGVGHAESSDLVGSLGLFTSLGTPPTAGRFLYVDNVTLGPWVGQIRHISRVEVKQPGDDEFCKRRRWSVRRDGLGVSGQPASQLVFSNLETVGSTVRLSGFGPFAPLASASDLLDPLWPSMAEYPLVEFAASYLLESGEARRVAVDRGLVDQREQANRVGASMQASQALLNRFERRIAAVGMPPMANYPHIRPYIG